MLRALLALNWFSCSCSPCCPFVFLWSFLGPFLAVFGLHPSLAHAPARSLLVLGPRRVCLIAAGLQGGPPRVVWLAPNPAPHLLARPGSECAPWHRALLRAVVRLCPLEACSVFPPLNAGGCCLVWRFWCLPCWFCAVLLPCHFGAAAVVLPAPALPSERSLRDQFRPCGGPLFPVVATSATPSQLCFYGSTGGLKPPSQSGHCRSRAHVALIDT